MDLYFDADIFRTKPAGIFRYSKEMASRFLADPEVNCRFVSAMGRGAKEMKAILEQFFGDEAIFYENHVALSGNHYAPFSRQHRDDFHKLCAKKRQDLTLGFKLRKEVSRIRYRLEARKFQRCLGRILLESDSVPVVFGSYGAISSLGVALPKPFRVQVLYDLIPKLYPHYFDRNVFFSRIFDSLDENQLIITISESTKVDLLRLAPHIDPAKVHAIPLASSDHIVKVDDQREIARVKARYGIPQESEYVFSLATVEPRKNHVRLLQAWSKVYAQINSVHPKLVIAGRKGWGEGFQRELHGLAEQENSVILTGFVDDQDLAALYSGSICTAYPSLYEGFGLPVLESMKCGRFCVTSNVSSMPEITGTDVPLVDPLSVDSIAELLLRVINDRELRLSLEAKCIEKAKEFSWARTYEQTKEVIMQAVRAASVERPMKSQPLSEMSR